MYCVLQEILKMVYFEQVRVIGLHRVSGRGKTTLYVVLCKKVSLKFYDRVCHVNLETNIDYKMVLQKILSSLSNLYLEILNKPHETNDREVSSKLLVILICLIGNLCTIQIIYLILIILKIKYVISKKLKMDILHFIKQSRIKSPPSAKFNIERQDTMFTRLEWLCIIY